MNKQIFDMKFKSIMEKVKQTRDAGQREYAHDINNVFANFERVGSALGISREKALMTYLLKHIDGVTAWVQGHQSQREDVTGRIKDLIVYLCLLWAMVDDDQSDTEMSTFQKNLRPIPSPDDKEV
tara:strand:+ start:580 stop:954 length:375 start_codon:yes stop_codon:yes gene_type:complete